MNNTQPPKNRTDAFLAAGRYSIVNSAHPVFFCTIVSVTTFLQTIRHAIRAVIASIPSRAGGQVAIRIEGKIEVLQVIDHSEAPSGDLFSQPVEDEGRASPEASARAAQAVAESKADAAREASSRCVKAAQALASDAESKPQSLEKINQMIALSDDPTALRNGYGAAIRPAIELDYIDHHQVLGGHSEAPAGFVSQETFRLQNCRLTINHTQLSLSPPEHDLGWRGLQNSFGKTTTLRSNDADTIRRLRIAAALDVEVDLEVSVYESTAKRKRHLIPLQIFNQTEIVESCKQELELLSNSSAPSLNAWS